MTDPNDLNASAEDLLEKYLRLYAIGLREKAKQAVSALVGSITESEAKDAWTRKNLHRLPINGAGCIPHEIYRHIVFPSLKEAFDRGDAEACYLLGKHILNLYQEKSLFLQMGERSAKDFFRLAHKHDLHSDLYRRAYLNSVLDDLEYRFHEWPSGLLINHDDWRSELHDLRKQISIASALDRSAGHADVLSDWLQIIYKYQERLEAGIRR